MLPGDSLVIAESLVCDEWLCFVIAKKDSYFVLYD